MIIMIAQSRFYREITQSWDSIKLTLNDCARGGGTVGERWKNLKLWWKMNAFIACRRKSCQTMHESLIEWKWWIGANCSRSVGWFGHCRQGLGAFFFIDLLSVNASFNLHLDCNKLFRIVLFLNFIAVCWSATASNYCGPLVVNGADLLQFIGVCRGYQGTIIVTQHSIGSMILKVLLEIYFYKSCEFSIYNHLTTPVVNILWHYSAGASLFWGNKHWRSGDSDIYLCTLCTSCRIAVVTKVTAKLQ